jgi:hypothetical protein
LIIWVCNRFDYCIEPEYLDPEYYQLIRSIKNKKNVYIFGNTFIENIYSTNVKQVDIGNFIIKPLGKNKNHVFLYKTYSEYDHEIFFIPSYHNETVLLNLSAKLDAIGIENKCEKWKEDMSELVGYKGIVCIPHSWSSIPFFEILQLGIVLFVPSESFLIELFEDGNYWFQPPFNIQYGELLKISEWYAQEHKDLLVYFDSWSDLKTKIKNTNYQAKTQTMLNYGKLHEKETLERWNYIMNDYLNNSFTQPSSQPFSIPLSKPSSQAFSQQNNTSEFPFTTFKPLNESASDDAAVPSSKNSNTTAIILTCTIHSKMEENTEDLQEKIKHYVSCVKKWLYDTSLMIILVENSGYDFKELEFEKDTFKDRFEMILFNESNLQEASYLKDNTSKGTHEVFSIYYAKRESKLIAQNACNFIIKVTGRFFIPELDKFIKKHDLSKFKALRQSNHLNCQIVGSHIEQFNFIFNKRCFYREEYAKYENDYIEILYKDRIDSLSKETVLVCPEFTIDPTMNGKRENITQL